jgi:hypothetical protein
MRPESGDVLETTSFWLGAFTRDSTGLERVAVATNHPMAPATKTASTTMLTRTTFLDPPDPVERAIGGNPAIGPCDPAPRVFSSSAFKVTVSWSM